MGEFGADLVKALISGISSGAGDVAKAIEHLIPGGGLIGKAASVIGLAEGGIVEKPTLAVVGEAGPEMVVPLSGLDRGEGVKPLPSSPGSAAGSGMTGGLHIENLSVSAPNATNAEVVNELYRRLRPLLQSAA